MALHLDGQKFSGAAKVWENFVADFPGLADDDSLVQDALPADEFRDEYVRLPYDDLPAPQECRW